MPDLRVDALVVGGGIAGMQAALDVADQGFEVALVERRPSIGGTMIALSKVFPTLDCCSCITTPKMSAVAHHPHVRLLAYCEVQSVERRGDGFGVSVLKKPRYVDESKCTGCRDCERACPITVPSAFDRDLGACRAIGVPFSTAVPQHAVLDPEYCLWCGKCERACPVGAVDFRQQPRTLDVEAASLIVATGFELTPLSVKPQYGAGRLANVIDPLAMERLLAPTGPYGRVLRPGDGKEPSSIAYVQCAGSRDETLGIDYCSRVCCMYAIKQAMLLNGALPLADVTIRSCASASPKRCAGSPTSPWRALTSLSAPTPGSPASSRTSASWASTGWSWEPAPPPCTRRPSGARSPGPGSIPTSTTTSACASRTPGCTPATRRPPPTRRRG
jgi:heterodisulfide reductase subunit A